MPEGLAAALAIPGLPLLAIVTLVAGVVYGFTGFGSALIVMPVATAAIPPAAAVFLMAVFGLSSAITVLPRAWALAERRPTLAMLAAAILALPFGTLVLRVLPATPLRWAISVAVAITLAALLFGWRRRAEARLPTRLAIGAASGLIGGATALTGPIVILFHLSGPGGAALTRANTIVFLTLLGIALIPALALQGLVDLGTLWLAALLVPVYMTGTRTGQALFRPGYERVYRSVAHVVIALAVLVGLPLWD